MPDIDKLADEVWQRVRAGGPTPAPARRRIVLVLTTNERKLPEYRRRLDPYDIEVFQAPPLEDPEWPEALLERSGEAIRALAVIREESDLYQFLSGKRSTFDHLERVENISILRVHRLQGIDVQVSVYRHSTEGYIDLSRRRPDGENVFGWDDIFVVKNTGMTYHELRLRGLKVSSRDMVVSEFLHQHVYYRPGVDLRFNPQAQKRPIDFANTVAGFVRENPYLNNEAARACRLTNAVAAVINGGVFFRAPENRREKNYWLPGLNAGIPFVPKKDPVHEITYMVHDFGHFLFPDLVFTGKVDEQSRRVYIAARMLSEAVTLVLADMLFVDTLKRSGLQYDWGKRRIYPLFESLKLSLEGDALLPNLEKLLRANVRYCLRGDDAGYRELLSAAGAGTEALERFEEKYRPFFVEDFRWTRRNWDNMIAHADYFARWWQAVAPLRDAAGLELETVEEFTAGVGKGDLVEACFARLFEGRLRPIFERPKVALEPVTKQLGRAFFRYMMGQLGLMVAFDFVPESAVYLENLRGQLLKTGPNLDLAAIDRLRGYYEQFVDLLLERNLLSGDDARTYKEVYPLFPPVFVHYDEQDGYYQDLAEVSRRMLG